MKTENMKTVGAGLLCTLAICSSPIGAIADADKINAWGEKVPFLLFDKTDKMEYRDAIAKAKKTDAKAFYWLAYYFSTGEGVAEDRSAAWRCLSKSASLGYPDANYAKGVILERDSFDSMPPNDRYLAHLGFEIHLSPDDRERYYSVNDDKAVAKVEELYNRAIAGGLTFATNDLARFRKSISAKRAEISSSKALASEAGDVLKALEQEEQAEENAKRKAEEDAKKAEEEVQRRAEEEVKKMKAEEEAKRKAEEDAKRHAEEEAEKKKAAEEAERKMKAEEAARKAAEEEGKKIEAEAAYWSSWPESASIFDEEIRLACENEIGVVIESGDVKVWTEECGKSLIVPVRSTGNPAILWLKYDAGRLVKCGAVQNFDEYTWLTNRAAQVTARCVTEWAKEHGMTYDEAVQKHNEYLSTRPLSRPRGLHSLSERRALREQARAEERARIAAEKEAQRDEELATKQEQREREREEQRAQLMQIQDELRKAREERAK